VAQQHQTAHVEPGVFILTFAGRFGAQLCE
jgi:hypothetical protein